MLRVERPDGEPLRRGYVHLTDPAGKGGSVRVDEGGRVLTPFPTWVHAVELVAPDGRATVTWAEEEQVIRLHAKEGEGR